MAVGSMVAQGASTPPIFQDKAAEPSKKFPIKARELRGLWLTSKY